MNKKTTLITLTIIAIIIAIVLVFKHSPESLPDDESSAITNANICNLGTAKIFTAGPNNTSITTEYEIYLKESTACDNTNGYKAASMHMFIKNKKTGNVTQVGGAAISFDYQKPTATGIHTKLATGEEKDFILLDGGTGVVRFKKLIDLSTSNPVDFKEATGTGYFTGQGKYETMDSEKAEMYVFEEPSEFAKTATDGYMGSISVINLYNLEHKTIKQAAKNISYNIYNPMIDSNSVHPNLFTKTVYPITNGVVDDAPGKGALTAIKTEVIKVLEGVRKVHDFRG